MFVLSIGPYVHRSLCLKLNEKKKKCFFPEPSDGQTLAYTRKFCPQQPAYWAPADRPIFNPNFDITGSANVFDIISPFSDPYLKI